MLEVTLDLRCDVCSGDRFRIPRLDEPQADVHCVVCHAYICGADELEQRMAAASSARRRGVPEASPA